MLLTGTFMVVLDFFIVNVALPSMQHDLHAGTGAIEWVVAGFALTSAVFLITAARLGDRIGRRRTFSIGLGVFTLASAACGAAGNPTVLVAARLAQGIGAALVMPNVLSIINVTYSGADLPRALGIYGLVMGLAAACGQLIGGGLIQADVAGSGWRACFLINVPVGVAALATAPRFVSESRSERRTPLDLLGTMLLTAGLTAVVLPLVEGRQHGWPAWTWISFGVAPLLLLGFVAHQRRLAGRGGGAPAGAGDVPVPLVHRRAADATRVLVRTGVVLPRARAVPSAGARVERARRRTRVHDHGDRLCGDVRAGPGARHALRAAAASRSGRSCWRQATVCCSPRWRTSASAARSCSSCRGSS